MHGKTEMPAKLVLPGPKAIVLHSLPNVLEGKIIPLVVFLGFLEFVGTNAGLLAALGWSLAATAYRKRTGGKVPGLLIVSIVGLTARTIAALATGSMVVYFLQPTISTALVGFAFIGSIVMGKPLAERLAHDFCPFDPDTANHPMLKLFFLRLSLLWAITSLLNAGLTLWLLLTQSTTTFVLIKSFLGPAFTMFTVGVTVIWFHFKMRRQGMGLEFSKTMAVASA